MNIQLLFNNIDKCILDEQSEIVSTMNLFSLILKETENIASVSEEHSASIEELNAITQGHNNSIQNIFNLIQNIKESSYKLINLNYSYNF